MPALPAPVLLLYGIAMMIASILLRGFRGVGGWFALMFVVLIVAGVCIYIANSRSQGK